ncbi:MAG: SlyX family protein [Puniceicoccaceae bacterium]
MGQDPAIQLEIKVTYLEKTLQELNEVVYHQQRTIDSLEKRITLLTQQLREHMESAEGNAPAMEKPPHY